MVRHRVPAGLSAMPGSLPEESQRGIRRLRRIALRGYCHGRDLKGRANIDAMIGHVRGR